MSIEYDNYFSKEGYSKVFQQYKFLKQNKTVQITKYDTVKKKFNNQNKSIIYDVKTEFMRMRTCHDK